jgi:hypothetical protein
VGEVGKLDEVEEERIEITCEKNMAAKIVKVIRDNHPYEEPVIDVYPLLSLGFESFSQSLTPPNL